MLETKAGKGFAVIGAIISWGAVLLQLYLMLQNRTAPVAETLVRFFSFFTILTNMLVAICFTSILMSAREEKTFFARSNTISATAVYILIVGIVYNLVLRSIWDPQGLQKLVDELLHAAVPLYFFLYWIIFVEKTHLHADRVYSWLIYPLVYLAFILVRGAVSGFYPYPFVNVSELGYGGVLKNSLILLGVFLLFSYLLVGIAALLRKKRSA